MGLFDTLIVPKSRLPGTPPSFIKEKHRFQTKSLGCDMATYELTPAGTLCNQEGSHYPFTGEVNFYDSNIVGCGPGYYTASGEDAESVQYKATLVKGSLVGITETSRELKPALPSSEMRRHDDPWPTKEEIAREEAVRAASYLGRTLFVHWGMSKGYYADVVAEDNKKLCVKSEKGLELIDRRQLGTTLFLTKEDDDAYLAKRESRWKAKQDAYNARLKEWELARSKN